MAAASEKSKPYIPLAGGATDGWSSEDEATATCFCGAVQLKFVRRVFSRIVFADSPRTDPYKPTHGPGLVDVFVCNCTDCHKISASMFSSIIIVADTHLTHVRGQENLSTYSQSRTVESGNTMCNFFCKTCGTLMYRTGTGFPGFRAMRLGTVDDFNLSETKLKPRLEQFVKDRVAWLHGAEGVKQVEGNFYV